MGALNTSDALDAAWLERAKRIGRIWLIIDGRVTDRMEKDEMDAFKISYKKRGGGWLVIVEGSVAGVKKVMFKDISDLADAGGAVKGLLEDPEWKTSKPFDQKVTKLTTDKQPGL